MSVKAVISQLKHLSDKNIEKILQAKEKRIELGGVHHNEQVKKLPQEFDTNIHGIHLEPCYKRTPKPHDSNRSRSDARRFSIDEAVSLSSTENESMISLYRYLPSYEEAMLSQICAPSNQGLIFEPPPSYQTLPRTSILSPCEEAIP